MFNALNRFMSRLDGDTPQQQQQRDRGSFGFQVLRNTSPDLGVEPWFDFIVGINGRPIVSPEPLPIGRGGGGRLCSYPPRPSFLSPILFLFLTLKVGEP